MHIQFWANSGQGKTWLLSVLFEKINTLDTGAIIKFRNIGSYVLYDTKFRALINRQEVQSTKKEEQLDPVEATFTYDGVDVMELRFQDFVGGNIDNENDVEAVYEEIVDCDSIHILLDCQKIMVNEYNKERVRTELSLGTAEQMLLHVTGKTSVVFVLTKSDTVPDEDWRCLQERVKELISRSVHTVRNSKIPMTIIAVSAVGRDAIISGAKAEAGNILPMNVEKPFYFSLYYELERKVSELTQDINKRYDDNHRVLQRIVRRSSTGDQELKDREIEARMIMDLKDKVKKVVGDDYFVFKDNFVNPWKVNP